MARYAIYFAPDVAGPLWRFGSRVIGYDAAAGKALPQWVPEGVDPNDWERLTAEPRRYGFHATLKAPFRLADGYTETDLMAAVRTQAATMTAFAVDLRVEVLDGFLALVPAASSHAIAALERVVVEKFDHFRTPLTDAERERRLKAPLTVRQRTLLDSWGYPYVLDQFRFHMTLSGRLPEGLSKALRVRVEAEFERACSPTTPIDRLVVFAERGESFVVSDTCRFSDP